MSLIDWIILFATISFIVGYGIWKSRGATNIQSYLRSDNDMKWWTIGLSIMATQASAITFLSTPGQAFNDGMRFVQFYFGLPIAMVIIAIVAIPIYHRLKVYTAYEYLESRFDLKTRSLGAILFLMSRSLAAGMTIYAPAIILALILKWNISLTIIGIGIVVTLYTASGGTKAVAVTQKQQMAVILLGMLAAGIIIVMKFPADISFMDSLHIAGKMGKLNVITSPESFSDFDPKDRYNIWSGLIGGTFLALSYFGTDQSQVQRYLGGKSITESRIGLLFNAIFKVPMQFLILLVGVMLFVFYQFEKAPIFFNELERENIANSAYANDFQQLEARYDSLFVVKQEAIREMLKAKDNNDVQQLDQSGKILMSLESQSKQTRTEGIELIIKNNPSADRNDLDQIFLTFVIKYLPTGLVGLLIAVILSAAMSSTSAELNALATTSLVDIYKRFGKNEKSESHYLNASKRLTLIWGGFAIIFALYADRLGNMIQAVNIIGSLFYPTILGIFVVAFFFKKIGGTAVFWAAIVSEILILIIWALPNLYEEEFAWLDIGFLWYNLIGCVILIILALIIHYLTRTGKEAS